MTVDPRGKVQIIRNTDALPAKCVVCHKPVDGHREYVDFGFDIDYYGQVLFCVDCLRPVAEACDYIPYDEFKKLSEVLEIALDRGKELEAERDKLANLLDGILGYDSPSVAVSDDIPDDGSKQSEDFEDESAESSGEPVGTESDLDESSTEPRQRDLPEITTDESNGSGINL